jgi:hypothetical protein
MADNKPRAGATQPLDLNAVLAEEFNLLHAPVPSDAALGSNARLGEFYAAVHGLRARGEPRTALCLSGGGIRSASFALGILQAFAQRGLLDHFHYLSTVSGGGYIGAWLSAWRVNAKNDDTVMNALSNRQPDEYKEPDELRGLRSNSNFLTPGLGGLSADTWTLVALYIRNLLLNWLIYLPLIVGVLLIPFGTEAVLESARRWSAAWCHLVLALTALLFLLALTSSVRGRLGKDGAHRVDQTRFLLFELVPVYGASLLLCIYAVVTPQILGDEWAWLGVHGPVKVAMAAGAALYGMAWMIAFLGYSGRWQDIFTPTGHDPAPPWVLLIAWVVAGALAGALIGWGFDIASQSAMNGDRPMRPIVVLGVSWVAVSMFLAASVYLGLTSYSGRGDVEREWIARSSGWFVALALGWTALTALVLYAPEAWALGDNAYRWLWGIFAVGGGAGAVAAGIGSSAKTIATAAGKPIESLSMTKVISLATIVFLVALTIILSTLVPGLTAVAASAFTAIGFGTLGSEPSLMAIAIIIACGAFAAIASFFINVNRFSMHALYRNRLIHAFLGSARGKRGEDSTTRDPFTGFDFKDNARVRDLMHPANRPRLFHVINMALNVVSGTNKAWQERMAESFTVTPKASGNPYVRFWPTECYGSRTGGISLGTAIAISGAAASPNQGYHSSPLVGLVMTLFNVRLGWWLGNPSSPAAAPREGPRWGIIQIVKELFGLTTDRSKYVYLSDGGHFENLGLYEMVRRRCHVIVVSDGGCDPDCAFADLGNAVRKIWIDLGVKIDFQKIEIHKRGVKQKGIYCALGMIQYPERPQGDVSHILYLKPGFHDDGTEPADVCAYALANSAFPHESTADQFFSESQMESYRSLGAHIVDVVLGSPAGMPDPDAPVAALGPYWTNLRRYVDQLGVSVTPSASVAPPI